MKELIFSLLALPAVACAGLDQALTRLGGKTVIELETCERLVNVSWQKSDLWILTRKECSIQPTEYVFKERSIFGILEGKIIIKEK